MTAITFTDEVTVEVLKHDFADEWVCVAARTSTAGLQADPEANKGLINALMRERHGSPFEHMNVTFRVHAPIFVWREHHRHRIASYNEESGRYKKLEPVFYVPADDRDLVQVGKAMDYNTQPGSKEQFQAMRSTLHDLCSTAYGYYEEMLAAGIMREVARMVLPVNIFSTCVVTMNARALMNFLSLRVRDDEAAYPSKPQHEISLVAGGYEEFFKEFAPICHAAFVNNGRVAP